MSFDLYVFPPPAPVTPDEVHALMELEEERLDSGDPAPAPTERLQAFLSELQSVWPAFGEDDSLWATWPLWQPVGAGTALNIAWGQAEETRGAVLQAAARLGLTVYDPQEGELIAP